MNISSSIRRLTNLFIILFVMLSGGLVYWQVVVAQSVTSNTHSTFTRHCLSDSAPMRGRILDRNGVVLAYSKPSKNPNLCGYQRYYTDPSLAGLIGYYINPLYLSTGIEEQYNDYLNGNMGVTGLDNTLNKTLHRPTIGDDIYLTIDDRIQRIVAQYFNEEAAIDNISTFKTDRGSVIVTDPSTGEILAMFSSPGYDPNRVASGDLNYLQQLNSDPKRPLIERPIDACYVPGSTYKTMTLTAGLDSGKAHLDDNFYNNHGFDFPQYPQAVGPVRLGSGNDTEQFGPTGNNISGYTKNYPVNLNYGFVHSDNVIFAQVGVNTGVKTWLDYNSRFYVGKQIPFDLPVRVSTVTPYSPDPKHLCLPTPPDPTPLSVKQLGENAFGQGVDNITPMQMSLLNSTIANNGHMMRPMLVTKIVDPNQTVVQSNNPQQLSTPISQTTTTQVKDAMYGVVMCGSGSLPKVQLSYPYSPWSVIGKTGTGEVDPSGKTPAESWFITSAPYQYQSGQVPRLSIVAMKENGGEGAYANGPMLRDIYNAIFTQVMKIQQPSPPPPANFCQQGPNPLLQ